MTRHSIIPDGPGPKQGVGPSAGDAASASRPPIPGAAQLAAAATPAVIAITALLIAAGSARVSPAGLTPAPGELAGWLLIGTVAALHRPIGGEASLGLGAILVPALAARYGAGPAAWVAAATLALAELVRRALATRAGAAPEAAGPLLPALERSLLVLPAVLVATAWRPANDPATAAAVAIGLYLGVLVILDAVTTRLRGRPIEPRRALPLLLDAVGWAIGAALVAVATVPGIGWSRGWLAWALVDALAAEAARNAILRVRSEVKVDTFARLQEAHERILSETSGMGEIARQVLVECRNILPVQWFLFELPGEQEDDWTTSWAAGPEGLLVEGRPKPPPRPKTLPGIHRRAEWQILDRPLIGPSGPDGDEATLASLRLWCDPRRVEPGATELFDTLLPQMASSVHRALLDREAKLDPLTGVPVRRVLEARFTRLTVGLWRHG